MTEHTVEVRMDRGSLTPFDVIERVDGIEVKVDSFRSSTEAMMIAQHWADLYGAEYIGGRGALADSAVFEPGRIHDDTISGEVTRGLRWPSTRR